jgi:cupin fold WbuC family metalloprotein
MINAMWAGTYPHPHRHKEGVTEEYIPIRGEAAFVVFNKDGEIDSVEPFGGKYGQKRIQVPEGVYHTVFALTPFAMRENKFIPGGYTPDEKEKASWAPEEGTPKAEEFLKNIKAEIQRLTSVNAKD